MIHVNDKLAPSAHQKLLQHVLIREALKRIWQKEHNKEESDRTKCNEVWNATLQQRGQKEPTTLHNPLGTLATALYKWGACVCLLRATPILSDIQQTTADTQHTLSTTLKHDHTPTSPNRQNNQQLKRRTSITPTPTISPVAKAQRQMTSTSSHASSNPQSPNPTLPTRSDGRQLRSRTSSLSNDPTTTNDPVQTPGPNTPGKN
jgi:hypothetical protein